MHPLDYQLGEIVKFYHQNLSMRKTVTIGIFVDSPDFQIHQVLPPLVSSSEFVDDAVDYELLINEERGVVNRIWATTSFEEAVKCRALMSFLRVRFILFVTNNQDELENLKNVDHLLEF